MGKAKIFQNLFQFLTLVFDSMVVEIKVQFVTAICDYFGVPSGDRPDFDPVFPEVMHDQPIFDIEPLVFQTIVIIDNPSICQNTIDVGDDQLDFAGFFLNTFGKTR
jgi:hypothetical protein